MEKRYSDLSKTTTTTTTTTKGKIMKLKTTSYKPTEFKKGYLRVNGKFSAESYRSKNHRYFTAEIKSGDSIDARGSIFMGGGQSRWNAPKGQWLKLDLQDGQLVASNYDGQTIPTPEWVQLEGASV